MRDVITDAQIERFWSNVQPFKALDACWIWTGRTHKARGKYGEFAWHVDGRRMYGRSHRLAYELLVCPIPAGLVIDHLCRTTLCVNPDHLEPVTGGDNVRRGFPGPLPSGITADGVRLCPQSHEIAGFNAMPAKGRKWPTCRQCAYERVRRFKERRAAA